MVAGDADLAHGAPVIGFEEALDIEFAQSEADRARILCRAAEAEDAVVDFEQAADVWEQHLAAVIEGDATGRSRKNRSAHQNLQPFDLRADRRLAQSKTLTRFAEATQLGYRGDCT